MSLLLLFVKIMYIGLKYVLNRSLPALFSLCCYVVFPGVSWELLGRTWRVARWHNNTPMNCTNRKVTGINILFNFCFVSSFKLEKTKNTGFAW